MSPEELGERISRSAEQVRRYIRSGRIRAGRTPGGQYVIPIPEVERVLREMEGEPS